MHRDGLGAIRWSFLEHLADRLSASWGADTAWIDDWDAMNPPRGQCGSSALVVQDLCGGHLMRGLVQRADGAMDVHYWNTLAVGQLDVTWQQFRIGSRIVLRESVQRVDLLTTRWLTDRYELLGSRVALQ